MGATALGARVARVLPAEPGAVPRVDARTTSTRRVRAARSTSTCTCRARRRSPWPRTDRAVGRERDAVGWHVADHGVDDDRRQKRAIKLRVPGWARNQPAPGGLYAYADEVGRNGERLRQRHAASRGAGPARLRDDGSRSGRTATSSRSSFPVAAAPGRRRCAREGDTRPHGHRARADRLLRRVRRI